MREADWGIRPLTILESSRYFLLHSILYDDIGICGVCTTSARGSRDADGERDRSCKVLGKRPGIVCRGTNRDRLRCGAVGEPHNRVRRTTRWRSQDLNLNARDRYGLLRRPSRRGVR